MANGEWFYARGNQQQGPVAVQALQDLLRTGQLQPNDLVWKQGMPNWVAASQVPELYAQPGQPAAPAAPAPPYAPPGAAAPSPYGPPAGAPYGQQVGYYGQQPVPPGQTVPNYLVQAILVTLFCCLPFGIVSIVYAAQVNSKLAAGDYAGALDSSQKAKTWSMWSFIIGLVFSLAYFALMMLGTIAQR